MLLMKVLLFAISITAAVAFVSEASVTRDEVRQKIETALSMRHPRDTPEWWRSLGGEAPSVITGMYLGTDNIYKKIRLLEALGWYDDPAAAEFLKGEAANSKENVLRRTARRTLAQRELRMSRADTTDDVAPTNRPNDNEPKPKHRVLGFDPGSR